MTAKRLDPKAPPLVIAHRGASGERPENTDLAYALAVDQNADMIEVDLHLTRDDAVVLTHDAELGHLGTDGFVGDLNLAEVGRLNAGGGWPEAVSVPELEAVLDRFGSLIPFNLEIKKGGRGHYRGLEALALTALRSRGLLESTLLSSFYDPVLEELRRLEPSARLATLLSPRAPERGFERAEAVGSEAVNPHYVMASDDFVWEAHDRGLAVYVYTVDDVSLMETLLDRGVDGLFTNWPNRMRDLIASPSGISRWG